MKNQHNEVGHGMQLREISKWEMEGNPGRTKKIAKGPEGSFIIDSKSE